MTSPATERPKIVHLAKSVEKDGAAVVLCSDFSTPIQLLRATATLKPDEVTCDLCLEKMAAPSAGTE